MARTRNQGPPAAARIRDADATRERILDAALREFADCGYAGARVVRIAAAAGVNVQLLYRYFDSKRGLHTAVQRTILEQRAHALDHPGSSLTDALLRYHEGLTANPDRLRFVEWEALQLGLDPQLDELPHGDERRAALLHRVGQLRVMQKDGRLPSHLPADLLYLAIAALAAYPVVFPQVTKMVTGDAVTSETFRARYAEFLAELGDAFDTGLRMGGDARGAPSHSTARRR